MSASDLIVALGSNQTSSAGSPKETLRQAIQSLVEKGGVIRATSKFYQTPCFPAGAGPDYVNAAVALQATWPPTQALAVLHSIEQEFGRARVQRWGQRTLDLDLIAYDDVITPDLTTHQYWRDLDENIQKMRAPDALILPHPRVQDRAFVLIPLADVAPGWVHPVLGLSVQQMLAARPEAEKSEVIAL